MAAQPAIVAYDVSDDGARRRVRRILRERRLDGQKSVVECLLTRAEAEELLLQLGALVDPGRDRLLLAWVERRRPVMARGCGRTGALFARLVRID